MRIAKFLMATTAMAALCATAARADLVISTKATMHMSCAAGACRSTAAAATLNVDDLAGMLVTGNVSVETRRGAINLVVSSPLSWASASRLGLHANQSVEIDKPVSVTGTGAVTITTNDGGSGGDLMFDAKGNVKFWDVSSSLVINGNSYTLVKDISTLASDIAATPAGFYALANDYDASADGTYSSSPVTTELTGTFEGLGHAISNLRVVGTGTLALFDEASGTLRDIGLPNVAISGTAGGASLLAIDDQVTVVGCQATGSVVATNGGIAGGLVAGSRDVFLGGTISRSHTDVSVSAPANTTVGGLVGGSGGTIYRSYATGRVKAGDNSSAGGLIGSTESAISQSYANGDVTAGENSNVGGLLGAGGGSAVNSYATGSVKAGDRAVIGGFAGNTGELSMGSLYSMGLVKNPEGGGFLGAGSSDSWNSRSYWDISTSHKGRKQGCGNSGCGVVIKGLTTKEFLSGLPEGFDPAIWGENANINGGMPYLLANPPQ